MASSPAQNKVKDHWSSEVYTVKVAPYVATLTEKVLEWLDPQPTDVILDIGCGDGVLTAKIAPHVSSITGVDSSPSMIAAFQQTYPTIPSHIQDCRYLISSPLLTDPPRFTKLFSNAALHWILSDASTRSSTIEACYRALRPGGLFVAELGGFGNVSEVYTAIAAALVHRGLSAAEVHENSPWWFPSEHAMKKLLEENGFLWVKGEAQLRQTELTEGEGGGIGGWVRLFGATLLELLDSQEARDQAVREACDILEGVGRRQDGRFVVNYVRLRFVARKPEA